MMQYFGESFRFQLANRRKKWAGTNAGRQTQCTESVKGIRS